MDAIVDTRHGNSLQADAAEVAEIVARAREASDLLKALSHEARLLILCFLSNGERSVGELETKLCLPQAAVSQHLARLRADGLVAPRRDGRTIYYSIADPKVHRLIGTLYDLYCRSSDPSRHPSPAATP